jgi:hypothetical protein
MGMEDSFRDVNQSGVNFVLGDLDLAFTFVGLAETADSEETAHRNYNNARKAYDTVLHLLETLVPTESERQRIEAKLTTLKARLQAGGQQF